MIELNGRLSKTQNLFGSLSPTGVIAGHLAPRMPVEWKTVTGSVVNILDSAGLNLRSLIAAMNPIQDLHGYDNPWPAGGGKNVFGPNEEPRSERYLSDTGQLSVDNGWMVSDYISVKPNTQYTFNPNTTAGVAAKTWFYDENKHGISYIVSGPTTFTTPVDCVYMRFSYRGTSTNIQLEEGSSATSYVPYSNICPITGKTGVSVVVSPTLDPSAGAEYSVTFPVLGKNLLNPQLVEIGSYSPEAEELLNDDTRYRRLSIDLPAGTYTFSTNLTDCYIIRVFINNVQVGFASTGQTRKITITEDANIKLAFRNTSTTEITQTLNNQIEAGSQATTYEPYTNTVYGGTLDVVSGELVVDRATRTLNGSEAGWTINKNTANPRRTYTYNKNASSMGDILATTEIISSYVPSNIFTGSDEIIGIYVDAGYLWIRSGNMYQITTLQEWLAWLASNPLQVVYKLAAPITYQLTPTEVATLVGTNNIWSDADSVEVEYAAIHSH